MVIHTKERPKLHTKSAPQTKIKGRNVLSISRGPEITGSQMKWRYNHKQVSQAPTKEQQKIEIVSPKAVHKKKPDKSTTMKRDSLQNEQRKAKVKKQSIIMQKSGAIKAVGFAGTRATLNELEGGNQVYESTQIMSVLASPLSSAGEAGKKLYHSKATKREAEKRIKKVNISRKYGQKKVKDAAVKSAKVTTKKVAKEAVKTTVKVSAQVAGAAVGTIATGAGGFLIGAAAGEAVGNRLEKRDIKNSTRNRMIQLFIAKLRQEENHDSIGNALKDVIMMRLSIILKKIAAHAGLLLAGLFALVALMALPIIAVVTVIYNSPLAIFFPSISAGETTQNVLSAYVAEFNRDVNNEVAEYQGYDGSEKIYVNYEGAGTPDNYYDILAVYMVKYGIGNTATDMTDEAKSNLKKVFDDMCSYNISSGTETESDEDGNETTQTIKYVNVSLKTYHDLIVEYDFNEEELELLNEIMKPENLAYLGYAGGGGDSGQAISTEQYGAILDAISDANGKKVVEFALSKVGYPYSQAQRDTGNYYDCSSLAYYAWRNAGVSIMYEGSNTAASEGKYCYDNNYLVTYEEMQPGDLIFYSYANNGRFMNISHVAVYVGNGMVVEAANERLGVVYRSVQSRNSIVFIGRPR